MILIDITIPPVLNEITGLRLQFNRLAAELDLSASVAADVELALAEIMANQFHHTNPKPNTLRVKISADGMALRVELFDDGGEFFEFDEKWTNIVAAPADPLAESGRGLWLVKASMDAVSYRYDNGNIWTLVRKFRRDKPRVLVIEDSEVTLALYHAILGSDHVLTCVRSIAETRALGDIFEFDLIIADYHIADGTSDKLLLELDERTSGIHIPVLIVSSANASVTFETAVRLGVHAVLAKPLRRNEVRQAVEQALAAFAAQRLRQARKFNATVGELSSFCQSATVHRFNIVARTQQAEVGSGDIFLDLGGENRRRFLLADLMGHGMKAYARAAILTGIIWGMRESYKNQSPSAFLNALSKTLFDARLGERLIGTVLLIDILENGTIELATAGHPSPAVIGAKKLKSIPLMGALPGLFESTGALTKKFRLRTGERFVAITDGLAPDATSQMDTMPTRFSQCLIASRETPIADLADSLVTDINSNADHRAVDDWTFVLIERVREDMLAAS